MLYKQVNQSFSRRVGKGFGLAQRQLLEDELQAFKFNLDVFNTEPFRAIYLEIGFGNGEHFINQALLKPNTLFIGAEAYLNGVANTIKLATEHNLKNIIIWPDDIDLLTRQIPDNSISGIYILFPDPWPKSSQRKKRLLNHERSTVINRILKPDGFCAFASDISDYYAPSLRLFEYLNYKIVSTKPHENYLQTKYHTKALAEGRVPQFFTATKK